MGTNYYFKNNCCPTCGRCEEEIHIGKSSGGWCFALHVYPERGINDLSEWKALFYQPTASIQDEYRHPVSADEMVRVITERTGRGEAGQPFGYADWKSFYRQNYAERGPNGLLRHRADHARCIRQGEGTWDCMTGDFS